MNNNDIMMLKEGIARTINNINDGARRGYRSNATMAARTALRNCYDLLDLEDEMAAYTERLECWISEIDRTLDRPQMKNTYEYLTIKRGTYKDVLEMLRKIQLDADHQTYMMYGYSRSGGHRKKLWVVDGADRRQIEAEGSVRTSVDVYIHIDFKPW